MDIALRDVLNKIFICITFHWTVRRLPTLQLVGCPAPPLCDAFCESILTYIESEYKMVLCYRCFKRTQAIPPMWRSASSPMSRSASPM